MIDTNFLWTSNNGSGGSRGSNISSRGIGRWSWNCGKNIWSLDAFPWSLPILTLQNCTRRIFLGSWLCKQALQGQGQIKRERKMFAKKEKCFLKMATNEYYKASATPFFPLILTPARLTLTWLHCCSRLWPSYPFQEIHKLKLNVSHALQCPDVVSLSSPQSRSRIL